MSKRSSRLSVQGSKIAKKSFDNVGYTKQKLAIEAELSQATIYNFFASKPVEKENFIKLCQILQLEPKEVADLSEPETIELIDELVIEARQKCQSSIIQKCGIMRVLDMQHSIEVKHIYTTVNILEKISKNQRKSIDELTREYSSNYSEQLRFLKVSQERVSGLEAAKKYEKLMVLGKPGAGKTTFLRYLAIQCISGSIFSNYLPIFVSLRDFANPDLKIGLLDYICKEVSNNKVDRSEVVCLFEAGRILLLLDGLDEVRQEYDKRVLREINKICQRFSNIKLIVTCRIAAKEYTFEQFRDVEVADFDQEQIQAFVSKWFSAKNSNLDKRFMENIRNNQSVKELANNPLLLTLLCIEFEDAGDFPNSRTELYQRATHTLLRKWDATRAIERDNAYKHLSVPRKENLLSHLALITFEKGEYFWKQRNVQEYIASYIKNFPESSDAPDALLLDSEAVLKSIESQHGLLVERAREVYSFSHLTFHEYFTAREIVSKANPEQFDDLALKLLVKYTFYKKWHEVFLLTAEMLTSADVLLLLMKFQIDRAAAQDRHIQELLTWANQKSLQVSSSHLPNAIRAFYLCLAAGICILDNTNYPFLEEWQSLDMSDLLESLDPRLQLSFYIGSGMGFGMGNFHASLDDTNLALDFNLTHARAQASLLDRIANRDIENDEFTSIVLCQSDGYKADDFDEMDNQHPIDDTNFYTLSEALYLAIEVTEDEEFLDELVQLYQQLPQGVYEHWDEYYQWYKNDSGTWGAKLKDLNRKYRNIDYDWQLDSNKEWGMLRAYCYANKLLLDCLHSQCYVNRETREYIQTTLLLPFSEIQKMLEA
ncbi:NACHT domain-containing NTPase [Microcoleus sp. FACHB-53]|nr:NACHT domain-containing NTPase [Microcoleus sp. FACHB-53]